MCAVSAFYCVVTVFLVCADSVLYCVLTLCCVCADSVLTLCCVCADSVLYCVLTLCCVCAVFQWYLIVGGAVFLMATSAAQPPAGGDREQS